MRLLLIRPGALGDTLLTFPVIEALRTHCSNPHIILVGNKTVLPLAQAFGLVEEVFDYEEPLWSGLFATPPSHVLGGNPSLRSILSGIDRAVAWLSDPDHMVYQNLQAAGIPQVTVVPGRPSAQERVHVVDYLACSVGVSTNPHPYYGDGFSVTGDFPMANDSLTLAGTDVSFSPCNVPGGSPETIHRSLRIGGQERAFAVHPGSGGARKCWPPERFAEVICRLWQRNWPILLLCGPADHERLEILLKLLPAPPQPAMLKLLVDVSLLDLVPILRQCRGYLGNDAGMTHLAALLGLPTLALFGPTDPLIWQPRGRAVSMIHEPNLEKLAVDVVIERIFALQNR
jgi:heptosyltransferase-3